jgi:hypothetical protein
LNSNAEGMAVVPCCQAEVARQLKGIETKAASRSLWEYPLHQREFGSHLTNVIRVLALQASGYRVTVTELVGWEHSLKNELILAEKISSGYEPARQRLQALLSEFPVRTPLTQRVVSEIVGG